MPQQLRSWSARSRSARFWLERWSRGAFARRPILTGGLLGGGLLLVLAALYPWWAQPLLKKAVMERLQQRLAAEVHIDGLDLGYSDLTIDKLVLQREAATVELLAIAVDWQGLGFTNALLFNDVKVGSGRVHGTVPAFVEWAKQVRGVEPTTAPASVPAQTRGRSLPKRLALQNLALELQAASPQALWKSARATLSLTRSDASGLADAIVVVVSEAEVESQDGRKAGAQALASKLAIDEKGVLADLFPATLEVRDGFAEVAPNVSLAGVNGSVTLRDRELSALRVDMSGGFSDARRRDGGELWSLRGEGKRDLSEGALTLTMDSFELGRVPKVLAALPLIDSAKASVGGKLSVILQGGKLDTKGNLEVSGLNIEHPLLAREPVMGVGFKANVDASIDPVAKILDLRDLQVQRGDLHVHIKGHVEHGPIAEKRRYDVQVVVPEIACQALIDAIPTELIPALRGMSLVGKYSLDTRLQVDFANLEGLSLVGLKESFGLRQCRPNRVPVRLSPSRLTGDLVHRVGLRDGSERTVYLSRINPAFAPLEEISPVMVAAVLTTEDGSFWRHDGFLTSQIANALRSNLEAGKVRLGASTITMQMVKNVFLSHERTLARKLQEVFLTWYVERSLAKERIMELYLNVIEYGPGIYGITAAADHYFGKTPLALNSLETAFLALMLPSPVRRHEHYCNGQLNKAFEVKLRRVHGLMASRGHISEQEYLMWKDATLTFDPRARQDPRACLREIKELLEASEGQKALSGLLGPAAAPGELRPVPWVSARPAGALSETRARVPATSLDDGLTLVR